MPIDICTSIAQIEICYQDTKTKTFRQILTILKKSSLNVYTMCNHKLKKNMLSKFFPEFVITNFITRNNDL